MPENDSANSLTPETVEVSGTQGDLSTVRGSGARRSAFMKREGGKGGRDSREGRSQVKVGPVSPMKDIGKPSVVETEDHGEDRTER